MLIRSYEIRGRTAWTAFRRICGKKNLEASGAPLNMKTTPEKNKDSGSRIRRWVSFHMTRLIDEWSFNAICFLIFLKLLQLCKLLGAKPTENGWRKVTGI